MLEESRIKELSLCFVLSWQFLLLFSELYNHCYSSLSLSCWWREWAHYPPHRCYLITSVNGCKQLPLSISVPLFSPLDMLSVTSPLQSLPRSRSFSLFLFWFASTGIDLENIVYYKDDTHYFVMTAKKQSLLEKGVILHVSDQRVWLF